MSKLFEEMAQGTAEARAYMEGERRVALIPTPLPSHNEGAPGPALSSAGTSFTVCLQTSFTLWGAVSERICRRQRLGRQSGVAGEAEAGSAGEQPCRGIAGCDSSRR
jgi:hypothetical protein